MKANETPEKIYVDSKAIGDNISTTVSTLPQDYPTCTEYIRADAFIEKASEWLSKHAKKYYFNKDGHYLGTDELIEDFKLSMELWHT